MSSAGVSQKKRKEFTQTQDNVSCQDMEVDNDKSLEEMGFVPTAVGEPSGAKYMHDKKCKGEGVEFCDLAAIVVGEDGKLHTIIIRNCYDCRLTASGESKVTTSVWKERIRQRTCRGRLWGAIGTDEFLQQMWERFTMKKRWAKSTCQKKQQTWCSWTQAAAGNMSHHTSWSSSSCTWVMTCDRKTPQCVERSRQGRKSGRLGRIVENATGSTHGHA